MDRRLRFLANLTVGLLTLAFLFFPGDPAALAQSGTLWVNDDDPNGGGYAPPGNGCNDPGYQTIQGAVGVAAPGSRINVCPGTYVEQVTVSSPGKDNITLRSVGLWQAI